VQEKSMTLLQALQRCSFPPYFFLVSQTFWSPVFKCSS
jgi:hypothetical protein